MITFGEMSALVEGFLDTLENLENPDEDLKRENIVKSFIEAANKTSADTGKDFVAEMQRMHKTSLSWRRNKHKNDDDVVPEDKPFFDYVYEDVLDIKTDVLQEYSLLSYQADDLKEMIESQKNYFQSQRITNPKRGDEKAHNDKCQEYVRVLTNIGKEVSEKTKKENLIHSAIYNSRNSYFNRLLFSTRDDFSRELFKIRILDTDRRRYINFGELAVNTTDDIMDLRETDYEQYLMRFAGMINAYQIVERILDTIKNNPLMSGRYHIAIEAMKYFRACDYQMFVYIMVPQIEGFFRLYMEALHIHKEPNSITDIISKIHKQEDFFEYVYFKYDFPVTRNAVAHGELIEITRERAYEILMDLHWVTKKIDSDDRDYKKWISWLVEIDKTEDKDKPHRILDYFVDGMDAGNNQNNLKHFFSHYYSPVIKAYGLLEAGSRFIQALKSDELYAAIWDENTPESSTKKESIQFSNPITGEKSEEPEEFDVVEYNARSAKCGDFVEILKQNLLCKDEWYQRYTAFVEKVKAAHERDITNAIERIGQDTDTTQDI